MIPKYHKSLVLSFQTSTGQASWHVLLSRTLWNQASHPVAGGRRLPVQWLVEGTGLLSAQRWVYASACLLLSQTYLWPSFCQACPSFKWSFFLPWNCTSLPSLLPSSNLKVKNNHPTPVESAELNCDALPAVKESHFPQGLRLSALTYVQGVLLLDMELLED